jgi:hypothetical protein
LSSEPFPRQSAILGPVALSDLGAFQAEGGSAQRLYNLGASSAQANEKGKQINESKIAFICFHLFFRIGTFQSVTGGKNKKSVIR